MNKQVKDFVRRRLYPTDPEEIFLQIIIFGFIVMFITAIIFS